MHIKRDRYLNQLISRKENGLIKVITGIRRCGKSYLLFHIFYDHLISQGVKAEQIIDIALDDDTNAMYRDPAELSRFIRSKITDKDCQYITDCQEYKSGKSDNIKIFGVFRGIFPVPLFKEI